MIVVVVMAINMAMMTIVVIMMVMNALMMMVMMVIMMVLIVMLIVDAVWLLELHYWWRIVPDHIHQRACAQPRQQKPSEHGQLTSTCPCNAGGLTPRPSWEHPSTET